MTSKMTALEAATNTIARVDTKGQNPRDWLKDNGLNPDDWNVIPDKLGWWETKSKEDEQAIVLERGGFSFERKVERMVDVTELEVFKRSIGREVKAKYKNRKKPSAYAEGSGCGDQQLDKRDQFGSTDYVLANWAEAREVRSDYWTKRAPRTSFHVNGGDIIEGMWTGAAKTGMLEDGLFESFSKAFVERLDDVEQAWRLTEETHYDVTVNSNHGRPRSASGSDQGASSNDADIAISLMLEASFSRRNVGEKQGLIFRRPPKWSDFVYVPELKIAATHGMGVSSKFGAEDLFTKQRQLVQASTFFSAHFHNPLTRYFGINPFTGAEEYIVQLGALESGSAWIMNKDGRAISRPNIWIGSIDEDGALIPMTHGSIPVGVRQDPAI